MKLVSISVVRNEADIIETFVRYHCRIVDAMIIVDHSSFDDTSKILTDLKDEGLPLHLSTESGAAHDQSRVVTRAAKSAAREHGADIVVPLDADEFLIAPGRSHVRQVIDSLVVVPAQYFVLPWITYIPTAADYSDERNVLKRITNRRKLESHQYWKVIIPGRLIRRRRTVVTFGNHGLERYGWIKRRKYSFSPAPGLALAHFPVRTGEQLVRKVLLGWPSHLARADKKRKENWHWERLYQRFRGGHVPTVDELTILALTYAGAEDISGSVMPDLVREPVHPMVSSFDLRYMRPNNVTLLMHLTAGMEQLARSLANCRHRGSLPLVRNSDKS